LEGLNKNIDDLVKKKNEMRELQQQAEADGEGGEQEVRENAKTTK
jgi:hypothetical protein